MHYEICKKKKINVYILYRKKNKTIQTKMGKILYQIIDIKLS